MALRPVSSGCVPPSMYLRLCLFLLCRLWSFCISAFSSISIPISPLRFSLVRLSSLPPYLPPASHFVSHLFYQRLSLTILPWTLSQTRLTLSWPSWLRALPLQLPVSRPSAMRTGRMPRRAASPRCQRLHLSHRPAICTGPLSSRLLPALCHCSPRSKSHSSPPSLQWLHASSKAR